MATVNPFAALRPDPALAARVCELPYDVLSSAEAQAAASGNPLSFFHVSKPEIDLDVDLHPADPRIYQHGRVRFSQLIRDKVLRRDPSPCFYLYRQVMGRHAQLGLVALTRCEEYLTQVIKRHELTRPDKEEDRVQHIRHLGAQTGPAFLVYPSDERLERFLREQSAGPAEIDFVAPDGVQHTTWSVRDPKIQRQIQERFAPMRALYIADGHHRTAAAVRVWQEKGGAGASASFLSVLFPQDQVQILPYHRAVKDLNGMTAEVLLQRLGQIFSIRKGSSPEPAQPHQVCLFLAGAWYSLEFKRSLIDVPDPAERLDVALLQRHVLAPLFAIENPRTSERIQFVGGIRGTGELEKLVKGGQAACAFSMYPTRVSDLMTVADAGGLMPPKSTWFEPKLRDGLFSHVLDDLSDAV